MSKNDIKVFGDYAHGLDVLGGGVAANSRFQAAVAKGKVVAPRAGFVQKTSPVKGNKFTSLVVHNPKKHDHKSSIANARTAGKRAVSIGNKLQAQLKKSQAALKKVAVRGDLLGATKATQKRVVHHLLSAAQMAKAAKGAIDAGNKASKNADTHEKFVKTLNQKIAAGAVAARQKLKMGSAGKNQTMIKGCSAEDANDILGAALDVMGTSPPDPNDPGWLMDGTVDPNYGGGAGGMPTGYSTAAPDPNNPGYLTDGSMDPNYGSGAAAAGPPDYGLGPAPSPDSVAPSVDNGDYVADPFPGGQGDFTPYSSAPLDASFGGMPTQPLPVGAVIYDGSVAPPFEGLGSYSFFYGDAGGSPPKGGEGSGEIWHNDGWWSFLKDAYAGPAGSGDQRLNHEDDNSATAMQQRATNSFKFNWGPMIGNPNNTLRGLRYDVGGNQWFWYYDAAPAWAQAPIKQALLNQALLDYQANVAAAAADYAAQAAQDQLAADQAKEMARQQAAEDLQQQHQINQDQAQAQSDAQIQSLADTAQAQEQATQDASYAAQTAAEADAQAKLDQSAMLTQAEIDQKAEETAARLDALAEQTAAAADQGGGDAGDQGGDAGDGSDDTGEGNAAPFDQSAKDEMDNEVMGDQADYRGTVDAWERGEDMVGSAIGRLKQRKAHRDRERH